MFEAFTFKSLQTASCAFPDQSSRLKPRYEVYGQHYTATYGCQATRLPAEQALNYMDVPMFMAVHNGLANSHAGQRSSASAMTGRSCPLLQRQLL